MLWLMFTCQLTKNTKIHLELYIINEGGMPCNHNNPISNHVALRISNFMNLKLYLIFSSLLFGCEKVILGEPTNSFGDGIWIKFL